jgi:beta-glucosidase
MKDRTGHLSRRSGGLVRLPGACRRPVTAAVAAVTLVIATLASVSATTTTAASATGRAAYLDSAAPVQARVADLLGRMTLAEKIGQMVQIEATQVTDTSSNCTSQGGFNLPNPVCEQKIFVDNKVGSILAGGTDIPPDTTGKGVHANFVGS